LSANTNPSRRLDRLIFLPVVAALIGIWVMLYVYTVAERRTVLERAQAQLDVTVATLADFSELAESAAIANDQISANRTAAIWRALLQYPSASIWVETDGVVTAGAPAAGDSQELLVVADVRKNFTVHAALPQADVLGDWRRGAWQRGAVAAGASLAFLLLTALLARTLKQRSDAQRDNAAAQERVIQLAQYRTQLEETVELRTGELRQSGTALEKELLERKAAENALREHDALLHVVTRSAAELLGPHHAEAIDTVLALIGKTIVVSRVQLNAIHTDEDGHLRSSVRYEWCAAGMAPLIDQVELQDLDLTEHFPDTVAPALAGNLASFFVEDVSGTYQGLFAAAKMRSFLQIPVMIATGLWGNLTFIDSSATRREWSWAETDTLKTLAGLIGAAIVRSQQIKDLADANMIVQNSPTVLYRLRGEPSFPLIYISHNVTKFGHDPKKLVASRDWSSGLIDLEDQPKVAAAMTRMLEKNAQGAAIEFRLRTGDGSRRWVENRYTPIRDKEGRLIEVEGIIIDITERKAAEHKIALLARTDGLTGLANRATFIERLRQAFASAKRGASHFSVLYLDLDSFKQVNDSLGHPAGDLLLCEVANRLGGLVRRSDVVARLGGDEFAVLQLEMGEPANAGILATKIQNSLRQPYTLNGHDAHISVSIGICPYSPGSTTPDAMLVQADLALYRSKNEGRDQYHFHTHDLDEEVLQRVTLTKDLKKALEEDQLELHYQPQVEVVSGKIVGMEALVRWHHATRGLLAPNVFIPIAEKSGAMMALGSWVLNQACRQMKLWRDEGVAPPVVAVNLSLAQLKNSRELLQDVVQTAARWELPLSNLEFDVTEATLAQVTLSQNDVLTRLRDLGAKVAIDDFGTEYSSFDYLRAYGVSHLKIAQRYISQATNDPDRATTIRAIINIARELGIGVIAEGVETEEQRALLVSTGSTTRAQGFYFSEAVDATRAGELLRQGFVKPRDEAEATMRVGALLTAG
jgi:diguanylate cyclase (GGDEF)-like protein/PAS domain S-box-containing protein